MKIVEIEWIDAQSGFSHPVDIEEVDDIKPLVTHSVGYLLKQDDEKVVLGFMMFDDRMSFKHWQLIPKGMIKKMKVIRR